MPNFPASLLLFDLVRHRMLLSLRCIFQLAAPGVCRSGSELLLLLRNSSHNNNTWGLPGGNVEDSDTDLLDTAKREAQEEMGSLPAATFQNQILTKYAS